MKRVYLLVLFCIAMVVFPASALTLTVYSTNASDGYAGRAVHNSTWATLHDTETGTESGSSGTYEDTRVYSDLQENTYWSIYRGIHIFDTSGLPDDCSITSATVGLWRRTTATSIGDTGMTLTRFNIDSTISTDDYNNFDNDLFAPYQNLSTMGTGKYYNFSLNALGLSNISKTGNTGIGSRLQFDIDDIEPTWASYTYSRLSWYSSNNMANIPFIEIEYTLPTPTPTPTTTGTGTASASTNSDNMLAPGLVLGAAIGIIIMISRRET